jgi:hypothetical protein
VWKTWDALLIAFTEWMATRRRICDGFRNEAVPRRVDDAADSLPQVGRLRQVKPSSRFIAQEEPWTRFWRAPSLDALAPLEAFIAQLRGPSVWSRRLDALETEVHRVRRRREARGQATEDKSRTKTTKGKTA